MSPYRFWWGDLNLDQIDEHGVVPEETEELFQNRPWIVKPGGEKYLAYGQTLAGRYLLVVFAKKSEQRIRVATARDMTAAEKKNYRARRK